MFRAIITDYSKQQGKCQEISGCLHGAGEAIIDGIQKAKGQRARCEVWQEEKINNAADCPDAAKTKTRHS